jgi:hypothetical protein
VRESNDTAAPEGLAIQFCPVCSEQRESRHRKLLCLRGGLFLSCSNFPSAFSRAGLSPAARQQRIYFHREAG